MLLKAGRFFRNVDDTLSCQGESFGLKSDWKENIFHSCFVKLWYPIFQPSQLLVADASTHDCGVNWVSQ